MTDAKRLNELRSKSLRYIYENGRDKIKGMIKISELKEHLSVTGDEWRSLYLMFINEGIAKTDGRSEHIYLTPDGLSEAKHLA